jgi:cytochrome c oxidase assembly factor CtaG
MNYSMMRMTGNGSAWPTWSSWHLSGSVVVVVVAGLVGLMALWPRISSRQKLLLTTGLVATVLLLSSDIQELSMSSYPSHMVEHIVVVLLIAPLIAGAINLRLSRPMATAGFFAFTLLVPLFHLTPLGNWVMQYPDGHYLELTSFLFVGVWFWIPVYGGRRTLGDQQRITYTVLALPVIATTGLVLWSSTNASLHNVGMNMPNVSIGDVRDGGIVMMAFGTALMFAHVAVLSVRAASRQRAIREPVGLKYA